MKKRKFFRLLLAVFVAMLLLPVSKAAAQEAYATLDRYGTTLTFYYDTNKSEGDIDCADLNSGWAQWRSGVLKVVFDASFLNYKPTNCSYWFADCNALKEIVDLKNLNTSLVQDMNSMFSNCQKLKSLDLTKFNTANVTDMRMMFWNCVELKTIYVGNNWSTNNVYVYNSTSLFSGCNKLYGGQGTSYKEYGDNITYARIDGGSSTPGYFTESGQPAYTKPVSAYAVHDGNGTLTFKYGTNPPNGAYDIEDGDLYTSNTEWKSNVKKAVFDASFANYTPSSCSHWFYGCDNMTEIVGMKQYLNTENVSDMSSMFWGCKHLATLDLSSFDTKNVEDMSYMFSSCTNLRTIYVGSNWNTTKVTSTELFGNCTKLYGSKGSSYKKFGDDITYARIDGGSGTPGYLTQDGDAAFVPEDENEAYAVLKNGTLTFYYDKNKPDGAYDVPSSDVSPDWKNNRQIRKVVFDASFKNYKPKSCKAWFSSCENLLEIEGMKENLNTEKVENMLNMFSACYYLKNADVSGFDTKNVTNMKGMFSMCYNLKSLDLSGFNTEKVENMESMFDQCNNLESLDLSSFNTGNVTRMQLMFNGCNKLTTLDLSTFNTGKVTLISYMFSDCSSLSTIYVGDGWTTSNFSDQREVFRACYRLTGGNGTIFNESYIDGEYAHIDDENAPGYFTRKGAEKVEAVSIELKNLSQNIEVGLGDYSSPIINLDAILEITFSNGEKKEQKPWYANLTGFNPIAVGPQTITVEYLGQTTSYEINIVDKGVNPYYLFDESDGTLTLFYGEYRTGAITTTNDIRNEVKKVIIESSFKNYAPEKFNSMFNFPYLTEIVGMENLNTEHAISMNGMFNNCRSLTDIDLSHFNTEKVVDMGGMFSCFGGSTLDLSSFNTSKVTSMYSMFFYCSNLQTIYVSDTWNTDAVTSAQTMFVSCDNLTGSKGTKYEENVSCYSSNIDLLYARIDEGNKNPGYLTRKNCVDIKTNAQNKTVADLYDNGVIAALETATEVDKVDVHRELKKDKPSTIVLPIDMDVKNLSDYKFYEFGGVTKNEQGKWIATYNQVENIVANTPYIVETTLTSSSEMVFDGGTGKIALQPTGTAGTTAGATGSSAEGWEFVGSYEKKVWDADSPNEFGFAANDEGDDIKAGDFVRIGAGASIKPMRSYLRYTKDDNPFSKAGEKLPTEIAVILIPLGSVVNPDDPNNDPNNGDIETPVSEIVPATNNDAKVWSYDKTIVIEAAPSTAYQVIDLGGRTLKNGVTNSSREEIVLGSKSDGMVIVRIDGKSFKIKY